MQLMNMIMPWRRVQVLEHERGLRFDSGALTQVMGPGVHWYFDPRGRVEVEVHSVRRPPILSERLDIAVRSGLLQDEVLVIDLTDRQRGLLWIDGRFQAVLQPGLYGFWTSFRRVEVEVVDAAEVRFSHPRLQQILPQTQPRDFDVHQVAPGFVGLFFLEGEHTATLGPGTHVFWKNAGKVAVQHVDLRETHQEVGGQEIMTADKVSLRLTAVITSRVEDPLLAVGAVHDHQQSLYRDAQLALRAVIGSRELDVLLTDKDAVADELLQTVRARAPAYGVAVLALGIRDIILPGDMKDLLNRVTEARKAAEATLITRREETAAMRSQANTARILESSPMLLRLRELEVLERVAGTGNLNVILGEQGLTDRITKLI